MHTIKLNTIAKNDLGIIINHLYKLKENNKINECEFICPIGYIKTSKYTGSHKASSYDAKIEAATYICNFLGLHFSIYTIKREKTAFDTTEDYQIEIKVPNIENAINTFKKNQYKQVINTGDPELKSQIQQNDIFNPIISIVLDELQKTISREFGLFEIYVEFDKIRTSRQELLNFKDIGYERLPNFRVRDALASLILLKVYEALITNKNIKRVEEVLLTHDSHYDHGMYTQEKGFSVCRVRFDFVRITAHESNLKKWMQDNNIN